MLCFLGQIKKNKNPTLPTKWVSKNTLADCSSKVYVWETLHFAWIGVDPYQGPHEK